MSAFRTLAKPNLVTQSGKEAKFISGGEFPFPVAQQNNTVTIEFKEFGVSILFTPAVVDGEIINLRLRPEVSTLDFSQGLTIQGFNIPTIRKNQALTSVNLKDGETFAIGGPHQQRGAADGGEDPDRRRRPDPRRSVPQHALPEQ